MEMPDDLRELVDRFGKAMVQALAVDPECRKLAREIQTHGFDIGLVIEATVALQERKSTEVGVPETDPEIQIQTNLESASTEDMPWSESDRAFLKTFKISLD